MHQWFVSIFIYFYFYLFVCINCILTFHQCIIVIIVIRNTTDTYIVVLVNLLYCYMSRALCQNNAILRLISASLIDIYEAPFSFAIKHSIHRLTTLLTTFQQLRSFHGQLDSHNITLVASEVISPNLTPEHILESFKVTTNISY